MANLRLFAAILSGLALAGAALSATGCRMRGETWIYTSLPKETIAEMVEPLESQLPDADIKWYQGTTEGIENKIASELASGKVRADIVITGNPIWFQELKQKGALRAYDSPLVKDLSPEYRDPGKAWAAVRLSAMVMGYNPAALKPEALPERWKDLTAPRFEKKLSMASPFESPATLAAVALLSRDYGWDFFTALRKDGLVAEGSHNSVLTRIETGERPLGILPLETILRSSRSKGTVKPIYPLDGTLIVPGPIAILAATEEPETSEKVFDWFFGAAAQSALVRSGTYSPLPKIVSPDGGRPWTELSNQLYKWGSLGLPELLSQKDQVRARYSEVVLH